MRPWTLAAVGLLSAAVEAAPRQLLGDELEARDAGLEVVGGVAPRSQHGAARDNVTAVPEGCPTGTVFVSTTTVDVTVYVTATNPAATEPCPDDETTTVSPAAATTEPCADETGPVKVFAVATRTPYANLTSTTTAMHTPVAGGGEEEPCETESIVSTGSLTLTLTTTTTRPTPSKTTATATATATVSSKTEEPCDDETATGPTAHKTTVTAPPGKTPQTTTICVIDTAMTPVSKTTLTAKPPPTVAPTKTVYADDKATGRPSPGAAYCGVRGEPAGTYFIAEFIEDRPGVPVTEEGCYQFCDSVMEDTEGCRAYRFYPNELGAPRCKLYGMPVSYDVRDIDNHQPGMWYDLACGPPSARSASSSRQQEAQAPQAREKVALDETGADDAVTVDDAKVDSHGQGAHGSHGTAPSSVTRGSTHDTTSPQPDMPPGNDNAMTARPEMPANGNSNGHSSPAPGSPIGGELPKGGPLRR